MPSRPGIAGFCHSRAKPIAAYIVGDEQLEVTLVIDIVDFAEPAAASSK